VDLREHLQATFGSAYRVDDEMHGAGMSRVFLAVEAQFGRHVVIKVLPPELSATVTFERFKREIQIVAQFHHPHIVPIITAGQSGDLLYYVMPLVGTETLRDVMRRQRELPLDAVIRYAGDVADALAYAHTLGVVHRDVKPENILLEGGRAMLADFGIARAIERAVGVESVTSTGLAVGTPLYMSPEQAAADKKLDGRSDIYSLACVVFEMLAGHPPFQAGTTRAIIAMHMNERPPSIRTVRPDLLPAVDTAILKALSKSPADRFATAREFIDALQGGGNAPQPSRPSRRGLGALIPMVAFSVAAIAAAVIIGRRIGTRTAGRDLDPSHIAVLQFDAQGADLTPVANGLSRDLIVALQNVPGLSVLSPEGVQGLANQRPDSIGRALDVGTIVNATLERAGDSLQLDIRLIESSSSLQRASSRIRKPASQFLRMRDSLVSEVAEQLRRRLGRDIRLREWRSQTKSDNAWTLRQTAEELLQYEATMRRNPGDLSPQLRVLARADSLLAAASRADRGWSDPVVARARIYVRIADYFEGAKSLDQVAAGLRMLEHIDPKWNSDPNILGVRGHLRYLRVFYGGAGGSANAILDSARTDLIAATSANEHLADAWSSLSSVQRLYGDLTGSVLSARRALATDAYLRWVPSATSKLVYALIYSDSAAEARRVCLRAVTRYPNDPAINTCELGVLGYTGAGGDDAKRVWTLVAENERTGPWQLAAGISPIARYFAAAVLARSGMRDSAMRVVAETRRVAERAGLANDYWNPEAYARMVVGDTVGSIGVLETAVALGHTSSTLVARLPQFKPLSTIAGFRSTFHP
jgi:serine/threonine-protein kinase